MHHRRSCFILATAAICFAVTLPGAAQSRAAVTVADYERAEKFLAYNTNPLVTNGAVRANWMPGDRFWYRNQTATGNEFILVDAAKATRAPAFDHAAVAKALTTVMGKPVTTERLPFQQITFAADLAVVLVRQRSETLDLRRARQAVHQRRSSRAPWPIASCRRTASSPRSCAITTCGSAPSHSGADTAAHHRRREGLRLRHRQRRLALQRSPGARLVARFEKDRDLPPGPAQDRRDVPGQHHRRPSHAAGVEIPAARRRRDHHDRARGDRGGGPESHSATAAARPAPLDDL